MIQGSIDMQVMPQQLPNEAGQLDPKMPCLDVHVVILNNYLRKHHAVSYRALAKRVRKLTILLSVEMEPDRAWNPEWEGLDVRLQKNWMWTAKWKHSAGFKENNFIHVPIDTVSQLKRLKPDIVFSYEMGMRTILSAWYRRFHSKAPLVMVGNMSEHIEKERGLFRKMMRGVVRRSADAFTFNGPSCQRYLSSLGIAPEKMFPLPYCIDSDVVFTGERDQPESGRPRRFLYCGSISERKGVIALAEGFCRYLKANPDQTIEFRIAGDGPLKDQLAQLASEQLKIKFLGNLDPEGLRDANRQADVCVVPTYADEWGLTSIEALASGIPVLGSIYAQSVETVVRENLNGWTFKTDQPESMDVAIERAMKCPASELHSMVSECRRSVSHISDEATARSFTDIIQSLLPDQGVVAANEMV